MQVGVTTKEEVPRILNNPTDTQVSTTFDGIRQSWAYVTTNATRQPSQYLHLLEALSINHRDDRIPFAMRFSPEGDVDALPVSRVHALGHAA